MVSAAVLLLAAGASVPKLADIQMHLFYEASGRLSPDLTQQSDFAGWNVITGGGSSEEPANDLLAVIKLKSSGEQFVNTPLRIVVTGAKGKTLVSRAFRSFLIPKGGSAYLPVWVSDAGCAGEIKVTAQFGKQTRSESLGLECGE